MAYSDALRTAATYTGANVADLIDGAFGSSGPLAASSSWSPTFTGFSASPSVVARYWQIGKLVIAIVRTYSNGTSNTTGFTITAPVTAKTISNMSWVGVGDFVDNGSSVAGVALIASAGTTFTLYKGGSASGWTNSGSKGASFIAVYEAV